jgi:hypothetical protein
VCPAASFLPFVNTWIKTLARSIRIWTLRKSFFFFLVLPVHDLFRSYRYDRRFVAFPDETKTDPEACQYMSTYILGLPRDSLFVIDKTAIDQLTPGDAVVIFTPDSGSYVIICIIHVS